jgi:hypothetical protein
MGDGVYLKLNEEYVTGTIKDVNKRWVELLKKYDGKTIDFISIQRTGTVPPYGYLIFYQTFEDWKQCT